MNSLGGVIISCWGGPIKSSSHPIRHNSTSAVANASQRWGLEDAGARGNGGSIHGSWQDSNKSGDVFCWLRWVFALLRVVSKEILGECAVCQFGPVFGAILVLVVCVTTSQAEGQ